MTASAPVSLGARRFAHRDVAAFAVRWLDFAPGLSLPTHEHPQATIAVVVRGGFGGRWRTEDGDCTAGSLIIEPPGAPHSNHFGPAGAEVVTVQPTTLLASSLHDPSRTMRPEALLLAWRVASELQHPDDLSAIALEGLSFEMLAIASRAAETRPTAMAPWLDRATQIVEESYARPLGLGVIAAEVGVHPVSLARGFRSRHGRSVGRYLREVRVRHAAARLATGDESIADVAQAVGFADQSHLHRWFVRLIGETPARYRRQIRGR